MIFHILGINRPQRVDSYIWREKEREAELVQKGRPERDTYEGKKLGEEREWRKSDGVKRKRWSEEER